MGEKKIQTAKYGQISAQKSYNYKRYLIKNDKLMSQNCGISRNVDKFIKINI